MVFKTFIISSTKTHVVAFKTCNTAYSCVLAPFSFVPFCCRNLCVGFYFGNIQELRFVLVLFLFGLGVRQSTTAQED